MAYSFRNPSDGIVKHYLETSKIIAVVGLSDREDTTSHPEQRQQVLPDDRTLHQGRHRQRWRGNSRSIRPNY